MVAQGQAWRGRLFVWNQLVEQVLIQFDERFVGRCLRRGSVQHRDPENSPAEDSQNGDQIHQALGRSQFCFFGLAPGFEDFVEGLDLPPLHAPFQFLDGVETGRHG